MQHTASPRLAAESPVATPVPCGASGDELTVKEIGLTSYRTVTVESRRLPSCTFCRDVKSLTFLHRLIVPSLR